VSVVQQPRPGFDDDVAATKRVIEQEEGPVVRVGLAVAGAIEAAARSVR
jgi:hypothetical protein